MNSQDKEKKETCCICGEDADFECRYCNNQYCAEHYHSVVGTGNCCAMNESNYSY